MTNTIPVMARDKKDETESARLSKSLMRKVRFLAVAENKSAPDLLNEILSPIIDRRHAELVARLAKEEARRKDT